MAATERGGGETFDLEISRHLAKLGCRVTFLSNIPVFGRAKLPVPNGVLLRSPMFPWFPWDRVKGGWRVRVWEFKRFEEKAARWIIGHADDFDIIQICELPYLVSILKSEIRNPKSKIVLRLTAPNAHDPWGGVKLADAVIASGTSISKIRGAVRPDVHDVPNAVDVERFRDEGDGDSGQRSEVGIRKSDVGPRTSDLRAAYGIPDSAPILLYVARFQAFKNHRLLLDAFDEVLKSYPEARLVLAGSGPLKGETEVRCQKSGIGGRVHFMGEVAYDDLPAVYRSADIKVISSEYESFCFAAIEAMAAGLPVVTTDCGWVPRLIGDKLPPIDKQWVQGADVPGRFEVEMDGQRIRRVPGGMVVSRTEPESLASAIQLMMRDSATRETCGRWNREKAVREHGWASSARKLLGVYQEVIGGQRSEV